MLATKITNIPDILHGTIPVSAIEKYFISTTIFNRLHNVLQNSTAYLTFPSAKHTRFEHSLGAMHVAGLLFHYGIVNADNSVFKDFLETSKKAIETLQGKKETNIINEIETLLDYSRQNDYLGNKAGNIRDFSLSDLDPFYNLYIPNSLFYTPKKNNTNEESIKNEDVLFVVFQALRIATLLHDIGHLPFSHVSEFAIEDVYKDLDSRESDTTGKSAPLNNEEKSFYNIIKESKETRDKLHEGIGNKIVETLCKIVFRDIKNNITQQLKKQNSNINKSIWLIKNVYLVLELSKLILLKRLDKKDYNENEIPNIQPLLDALFSILSDYIDADRIDFILRDRLLTGFDKSTSNIDRLIKTYTLINIPPESNEIPPESNEIPPESNEIPPESNEIPPESNEGDPPKQFAFLPSSRAISNIEDILQKRFDLYRFIVSHHRVKKTDGLLREVIKILIKQHLEQSSISTDHSKQNTRIIPNDISGLWQAFQPREGKDFFAEIISQWDDRWLFNILRNKYFSFSVKGTTTNDAQKEDDSETKLKIMLEELLTNRKKFFTLFKRLDNIENPFSDNELSKDLNSVINKINKIDKITTNSSIDIVKDIQFIKRLSDNTNTSKTNTSKTNTSKTNNSKPMISEIINHFKRVIYIIKPESVKYTSPDEIIKDLYDKTRNSFLQEINVDNKGKIHVFDVPLKVNSGFKSPPNEEGSSQQHNNILCEGMVRTFSDVSHLEKKLKDTADFLPSHFIYVNYEHIQKETHGEQQKKYAKMLAKTLIEMLNSSIDDYIENENSTSNKNET